MKNIAAFTHTELTDILGLNSRNLPGNCIGISTDSRSIEPGNLYVPLIGEQFDGHAFIEDIISKGACGTLIQESKLSTLTCNVDETPHIIVPDTLHALGALAHAYRKRFDIPIFAIAGAAGKTSTKDCAAHVLSTRKKTLKTIANYNNQIGVPLMMFMLNNEHESAVIEIGTNEPGEIAILTAMLAPTHGLITNIGKEHLEKLIDLDGVEKEETALFAWLEQCGGTRLINMNDERLSPYAHGPRVMSYALDEIADIFAHWTLNDAGLVQMTIQSYHQSEVVNLSLPGKVGAMTAIAAACIGLACEMSIKEIAEALHSYDAPVYTGYGRMARTMMNDIIILNDSYNANPASMITALETLQSMPCIGKRIALLGDMRELGASSIQEHVNLLNNVNSYCDVCIVTGQEFHSAMTSMQLNNDRILYAKSKDECAALIHQLAISGDIVLIKGSRGIKLEQVLEQWRNLFEQS